MAKNDGKIYITISDTRGGKGGPGTGEVPVKKEKEKKNPLADYAKHAFFNLIESQAKQAVTYTISNIGNFTGDYISQTHVQDSMEVLNSVINLGMSFAGGTVATGSPIGGLIAVGTQLIGKGISTGMQYYAGYVENVRINKNINLLRTRSGLNSSNNGSRGTDQ